MALAVGSRLGPYEVTAPLGAGGMGQVYRAKDSRLGREVALKILSDLVSGDPERIARFEREARTLASLNHPNIGSIYGVEDSDGVHALVLELVEGPTLADRIAQGPMPLDEALAAARQIADALESAHDLGIVHRDLKPANIKLRPDGTVKVLDFGLAKAIAAAQGSGSESRGHTGSAGLSHSPTITGPIGMTGVGVLLGTAAYMPPEQARGKPVDKRADVWAFGCVLFEMLTAKRCFDGEDTSLTLAEVIKSEPDWSALPTATPPAVRSTIKQCLQKDPKQRVRDIGDVRLALEGAFSPPAAYQHDRPSPIGGVSRRVAAALGLGIAIGALGVAAMTWVRRPAPPAVPLNRFSVAMPTGTNFRDNVSFPIALTRDGRRLVVNVSGGDADRVMVRSMDQVQLQPVHGLEGVVGSIILSPDGEWVAFNDSKGSLKRMRLAGGPPATIAETGIQAGGWQGASWGSAGTIVFSTSANRTLMEVPESGGTPKPRTKAGEADYHQHPHFLPDGRSLLFVVRRSGRPGQIAYLPAGATDHVVLLEGTDPRYVSSGHLLFTREAAVWAVGFDADAGRTIGDPAPVLEGVSITGSSVARAAVSADGTLAYVAGRSGAFRTVVRFDRQGHEEALPGLSPNSYGVIRVSPDGTRLAFDAGGTQSDVWTYDFARGATVRVTTDGSIDRSPLWIPDGSRLIFSSDRDGQSNLYVQNADGTGAAERLLPAESSLAGVQPEGISRDGKMLFISFTRGPGVLRPDLGVVDIEGERRLRELVAMPSIETAAALSPDGRWLAYQSDFSGIAEVYVERFPELGDRQKISTSGGTMPRWAADSTELFYQSMGGRRVHAVSISGGPKLRAGTPVLLFEGPFVPAGPTVRGFDVTPDGRFILIRSETTDPNSAAAVVVVQNWIEELKRLVPLAGQPK